MSSSLAQSHLPGLGPIKMAVRGPGLHLAPRTILLAVESIATQLFCLVRYQCIHLCSYYLCVHICICVFANVPFLLYTLCLGLSKNISFGFENSYFSLEFLVKLLVLFTCFFVFCLFGFFPNIANFVLFK